MKKMSNMKKFLGVFAAYTATGKGMSKGLNNLQQIMIEQVLAQALVNTDTLDVTLPTGIDPDVTPIALAVWPSGVGSVAPIANLGITNHNRTTGVTRLTATGNVAIGSSVILTYMQTST